MKRPVFLTSVLSDIKLPATQVENIVNYRLRKERNKPPATGIDKSIALMEYEAIITYSTQVTTKGNVSIYSTDGNKRRVKRSDTPMSASFLVTCIKGKTGKYGLGVSTSLC